MFNKLKILYAFTLTETTDVTLSVQTEFPVLMGFVSTPCAIGDFISYIFGAPGEQLTLTKTLPAGAYNVFIAPQDWSTIITCGEESRYRARLELATPAGSTAELEPCGADLNGGCNMTTPVFEPIALGETKNGTAWCNGTDRDTDWYIFTLTEKTRVTLTAEAEFPLMIGFTNSPCPVYDFINYQSGESGTTITVTSILNPGTYYAWIGQATWGTITLCGGADKYWAKLTGSACFEPTGVTASLVTATTATMSWTAPVPLPGSGYQYEIRTSGAPGSGATGLAASGTTPAGVLNAAVSGLTPGTAYFAYVRSNCGGTSFSQWSALASFTTPTIAVNLTIPSAVVSSGQSFCYNALQTITVGGNPPNFVVFTGGSSTMIAGLNIHYFPGVLVLSGGFMHGYIAPSGPFCVTPPLVKATVANEEDPPVTERSFFKVYPNPTTGNFTLEQKRLQPCKNIRVEVYTMRGVKILTSAMNGEWKLELSISEMPVGLYFVKVIADDRVETFKLIRSR